MLITLDSTIVFADGEDTTVNSFIQSINLHNQRPDEWTVTLSGGDLGDAFDLHNMADVLTIVLHGANVVPLLKDLVFSAFGDTHRSDGRDVYECARCAHITCDETTALCHADMPHADDDVEIVTLLKGGIDNDDLTKALKIATNATKGVLTTNEAHQQIIELINEVVDRVVDANDVQRVQVFQ